MNKILLSLSIFGILGLATWVYLDPAWVDVWVFNKEIIMTNLAKWIPVAVMWSIADNIVDRLFQGTKIEKWFKGLFT